MVRIFEEGRRGMKRPGLPTQNQRNKRKDGEADRWPDASFFPLNEGNIFLPSCLISNGEGNIFLLSCLISNGEGRKHLSSFLPNIKRGRKHLSSFLPNIKRGRKHLSSCLISNGEGNKKGQQRNALLANVLRLLR